jgi:disulfide bond formation protein DsbB
MNSRRAFALPLVLCALLLGYAYYLQFGLDLEPCPLCLVQRGFFYAVGVICLLGVLHGPRRVGIAVYGVLAALFAVGGAATATRQVWLQHLPADKVPQCGPDLYFMLENLPLARTLEKLIQGSGECAAVDWKFLGLSIAGWSLVWFVVLAAYVLSLATRAARTSPASA